MKIGIYGGSFNPPHLGHMAAAESAAKYLGLDELLLIPAGIPPQGLAVHRDDVRLRVRLIPQGGGLSVDPNPALPQQLLRRPAGAYPGSRYDLLQSLLHGVSSRRWSAVSCPAGWAKPQSYRAA